MLCCIYVKAWQYYFKVYSLTNYLALWDMLKH